MTTTGIIHNVNPHPVAKAIIRHLRPGMFPGICFEANDDKGGEDNGGNDDTKVEFTPAQQAKLNSLINEAVGRAAKDWGKRENDYKARIEKLEAGSKNPPKPEDKKDGEKTIPLSEYEKAKANWETETKTQVESYKTQVANLLGEKRNAAVVTAASKLNVVDPGIVSKLVSDAIGFDEDGSIIIKNDNGGPRYGKNGPMTVEEFLGDFLKDKPFLLKSGVAPGGGSKPGNSKQNTPGGQAKTSLEKLASGLKAIRPEASDDLD